LQYSHQYTSLSRTFIQKLYLVDKSVTLLGGGGKKVEASIREDYAKAELAGHAFFGEVPFEVLRLRLLEHAQQAAQAVNLCLPLRAHLHQREILRKAQHALLDPEPVEAALAHSHSSAQ
jgi:hypothetical protein